MTQVCVVNCSSCETFQGQQVKKGKKWTCKMCGEKQSFRQVFAQGSGKECRQVVQKLNMISGNVKRRMLESEECVQEDGNETTEINGSYDPNKGEIFEMKRSSESKWNQFVSTVSSDSTETEEPDDNTNESSFTTERTTLNKYKAQKRKKSTKDVTSNDLHENQRRKAKKIEPSKITYPHCKSNVCNETSQIHLESLDHEVSADSQPRHSVRCQENESTSGSVLSQRQTQTSSATETRSSTKLSKWSKYTL